MSSIPKVLPKAHVVLAPNNVVNVHVSSETLFNLEATNNLRAAILGRLGHPGCCSGFQILFHQTEGEFNLG